MSNLRLSERAARPIIFVQFRMAHLCRKLCPNRSSCCSRTGIRTRSPPRKLHSLYVSRTRESSGCTHRHTHFERHAKVTKVLSLEVLPYWQKLNDPHELWCCTTLYGDPKVSATQSVVANINHGSANITTSLRKASSERGSSHIHRGSQQRSTGWCRCPQRKLLRGDIRGSLGSLQTFGNIQDPT